MEESTELSWQYLVDSLRKACDHFVVTASVVSTGSSAYLSSGCVVWNSRPEGEYRVPVNVLVMRKVIIYLLSLDLFLRI